MALVTMASTEEAIDALVVRFLFLFFYLIVYEEMQSDVKPRLDVTLKVPHFLTLHFPYF